MITMCIVNNWLKHTSTFFFCAIVNVVNNLFTVTNASAIKDLPLHACNFHDTRVWNHSVNGNYTVKSAHMLCMSLQEEISSSSVTTSRNWNGLWK